MYHKIYHMYLDIKSPEKFGSTNKHISYLPQNAPTMDPRLTIWKRRLLNLMVYNYYHLKFVILMKLALTQMGAENSMFVCEIGAIIQVSGAVKLVSVHLSGASSSSSCGQMDSA